MTPIGLGIAMVAVLVAPAALLLAAFGLWSLSVKFWRARGTDSYTRVERIQR